MQDYASRVGWPTLVRVPGCAPRAKQILFRACFPARIGLQIARMKKLILGLTLAAIACVSAQAGDDKKTCDKACADKAKATCSESAKAAGADCSGCTGKAKFTRKVDPTAKGATLLLVRR